MEGVPQEKSKIKSRVAAGIFVILAVFSWIMFSLPLIIYYIPQNNGAPSSEQNATFMPFDFPNCSRDFFLDDNSNLCKPVCGEWKEFDDKTVSIFDGITTFLYVIHMIGTATAVILSCIFHKHMLKFPSILLVYFLIPPVVFDVIHLVGFVGRDSLFCRSRDLLHSIENPTAFCSLTGVVNSYVFTIIDFMWFFHTLMIFVKVWFPVASRQLDKSSYKKYIHLAIVLSAFLFSWIPVGVAFGTGGYNVVTFPPFNNCFQSNPDATLYSFIFPKCFVFSFGITLILLVIWKLIDLDTHKKCCSGTLTYFTAEVKLIAVFIYFTFAVTISLTLFISGSRNIIKYQQGFQQHFVCEAFGVNFEKPCLLGLDRRGDQVFNIIAYAMFAFAPYVALIYILHIKDIKVKWNTFKKNITSGTSTAKSN